MKKMLYASLVAVLILMLSGCSRTANSETQTPATDTTATETATQPSFQGMVLADNETATVKITTIDESNFWGYTLKVFLENKTDKELMFTVDSVSVNGFMCDPFWATTVAPGMKANEEISFSESDFAANGIETVEEIQFTLRVYDSEDFQAGDLIHEKILFRP